MREAPIVAEPQLDRRKFAIGALCCAAAGAAAVRRPTVNIDHLGRNKLEDLIPTTVGPWKFVTNSGLVVPPEDQLSRALYSQLLTRVYDDGVNPPVMFLAAQSSSQTGILQIHRPETCYTAGGFRLSPVNVHPVQLQSGILRTTSLSATADGRIEHILYWTRIGNHLPTTWPEQRFAVAVENLRGNIPDAIMVRVSTVSNDKRVALAAMGQFIRRLLASIPEANRRVFIV